MRLLKTIFVDVVFSNICDAFSAVGVFFRKYALIGLCLLSALPETLTMFLSYFLFGKPLVILGRFSDPANAIDGPGTAREYADIETAWKTAKFASVLINPGVPVLVVCLLGGGWLIAAITGVVGVVYRLVFYCIWDKLLVDESPDADPDPYY